MKTYLFKNIKGEIVLEAITDGIGDQKQFNITEWPLRNSNGNLGEKWNVGPISEDSFIEFSKENNLYLISIDENGENVLNEVILPVAPKTTPVSPTDNQTDVEIVSGNLTLSWNAVEDKEEYVLRVWKSSQTESDAETYNTTSESYEITGLLNSTEYKWDITTKVKYMQDSVSGPWTFTTVADGGAIG